MKIAGPLWLASRSPRRRQMLIEAGYQINVFPADLDDANLRSGQVSPINWVMALAYLKARRVADLLRGSLHDYAAWWDEWAGYRKAGVVLGADTVCVRRDEILGQPRDETDACRMLHALADGEHETITGVCVLPLDSAHRIFLFDRAVVHVGALSEPQIAQYIATGDWRGKAGAYNLSERIDAGWPIECHGDPATVMGLPMRKLKQFTIGD